jgi:uncharacterized protein YndB with AHSA1/START domain
VSQNRTDTFDRHGAGDRSVLRLQRHYPHPVRKVWDAVTTPEHLAAWFPAKVSLDLRVDGEIRFSDDPNQPDTTGRVTDLDPPGLFAFTWVDDHIRFELAEDGDGTLLRLVHTFGDTAGAASFASGWAACLEALGAGLAGEPVPLTSPGTEAHERYVALFHLDRGTVEPGDGVWRVTFERQLTQPLEDVEKVTAAWPGDASWELGEGTGHGPRLHLTVTAPTKDAAEAAHDAWRDRIEALAAGRAG